MRKALVIGIDDYPDDASLEGCVNDAVSVANLLEKMGMDPPILMLD